MENAILKLKKEKSYSLRVAVYRNSDKKPLEQIFNINSHEQMHALVNFLVRSYTGNTASRGVGVFITTEESITAKAGFAKDYGKTIYTHYYFFFWEGRLSRVEKKQSVWFHSDTLVKNGKWCYFRYRSTHKNTASVEKSLP